jgi:hypothetical protein
VKTLGDLVLEGMLDFSGNLTLEASGGKVKVGALEVLVELLPGSKHGMAPPVILPPPPASPIDAGPNVVILNSLNKTVKIGTKAIVTQGMAMQGNSGPIWPGMVLPSKGNTGMVSVNRLAMNVQGDQAIIFPSGGMATFDTSGQ